MNDIKAKLAAARRALGPDRLLVALAVLLAALALVQGGRRLLVGRHERAALELLTRGGAPPEREKGKPQQECEQAIMDHGMLGSIVKMPVKLWGIMGNSALFGTSPDDAQPMSVGDMIPSTGEKIVEVRIYEVVLEKEGKRRTEAVFDELKGPQPGGPSGPPGMGAPPGMEIKPPERPGAPAEARIAR